MGWFRRLRCWWRGHVRIAGLCAYCWRGAHGERLRPISGGEGEDLPAFDIGNLAEGMDWGQNFDLPTNFNFDFQMPDLGGGGPGGTSWLDKISGYAEKAMPWLKLGVGAMGIPLGISAMNQASQQTKMLTQAQKRAGQIAEPAAAGAGRLIPAGVEAELTGKLPPELEAQVETAINSFRQQRIQALVKQGTPAEVAQAQIQGEVEAYSAQIRAQYAAMLMQGGQGLTQAALGGTGQVADIARGQIGQADTALSEAEKALARLLGMG